MSWSGGVKERPKHATWLPRARRRDLIVKRLEGELLIYDVERHRAHSLGALLAALWQRCDGKTPPAALAAALAAEFADAASDELIWLGLERLSAAHLLREELPPAAARPASSPGGSPTRRQWLRHAAAIGMAAVTITVPTLAEAATTIRHSDCMKRDPPDCGNTPCSDNPGTVCKSVLVGMKMRCRCA